jgi:hypothetical protein
MFHLPYTNCHDSFRAEWGYSPHSPYPPSCGRSSEIGSGRQIQRRIRDPSNAGLAEQYALALEGQAIDIGR